MSLFLMSHQRFLSQKQKMSTKEIQLEHIKHLLLKRDGSPKNKNVVITDLLTLVSFAIPFPKIVHFQNTNEDNET